MKHDEIKTALECCINCDCKNCPCDTENDGCKGIDEEEILAYINQLESELQLLKNDYDNLKSVADETIERNQRLREKLIKALNDFKTAKNKAIKEFAERLKEAKANSTMDSRICTTEMVDNLVAEMIGEIS